MDVVNVKRNSPLLDDVWTIYRSVFPEYERVPENDVLNLIDADPSITLSAYLEDGAVAAMTFVLDSFDLPFAYFFFLGVSEKHQGEGTGSRVLDEVKKRCARPILLDMEVVGDPQAKNPEQRKRRLRFYRRNGFTQTGLMLPFEGVPYEVMAYGADITQEDVDALDAKMNELYERYC